MIFAECVSVECYDLWCQSGAGRGVTADFQRHPSCGGGGSSGAAVLGEKKKTPPPPS